MEVGHIFAEPPALVAPDPDPAVTETAENPKLEVTVLVTVAVGRTETPVDVYTTCTTSVIVAGLQSLAMISDAITADQKVVIAHRSRALNGRFLLSIILII